MKRLGRTSRLILTVMAEGPAHGYGVITWVAAASGGTDKLGVGAVYGSIEKLEKAGLIEHDRDDIENGRSRRYFCITSAGRTRLQVEIEELATEINAAQRALRNHPLPNTVNLA